MTLAGFTPSFIVLPITLALSLIFWGLVLLSLKHGLRSVDGEKIFGYVLCSALGLRLLFVVLGLFF